MLPNSSNTPPRAMSGLQVLAGMIFALKNSGPLPLSAVHMALNVVLVLPQEGFNLAVATGVAGGFMRVTDGLLQLTDKGNMFAGTLEEHVTERAVAILKKSVSPDIGGRNL